MKITLTKSLIEGMKEHGFTEENVKEEIKKAMMSDEEIQNLNGEVEFEFEILDDVEKDE